MTQSILTRDELLKLLPCAMDKCDQDRALILHFGPAAILSFLTDASTQSEGCLDDLISLFEESDWSKALLEAAQSPQESEWAQEWQKRWSELFREDTEKISKKKKTSVSSKCDKGRINPPAHPAFILKEAVLLMNRLACHLLPNAIEEDPYLPIVPHPASILNAAELFYLSVENEEEEDNEKTRKMIRNLTKKALETAEIHREYLEWRKNPANKMEIIL